MEKFSALYYKDRLVVGLHANISVTADQLRIDYRDESSSRLVYWAINDIERADIMSPASLVIITKTKPVQSLVFQSTDILQEIKVQNRNLPFLVKNHNKRATGAVWGLTVAILLFIVLMVSAYIFLMPMVSEKLAEKIPSKFEKEIGASIYSSTIASYKINAELTKLSQQFFDSLKLPQATGVKITVVKSNDINAFALPGGYIVVYDSILGHLKNFSEYAALLAHEYSHVKFRHSLKGMARELGGSLVISIIMGDNSGTLASLASNAHKIKGMQYSRELEKQADEEGVTMLAHNGIDPKGALGLFKSLEKVTGASGSEFLSTHPLFKTRSEYIETKIKTLIVKKNNNAALISLFEEIKFGSKQKKEN